MGFRHLGYTDQKGREGNIEANHFIDLLQERLCGGDWNAYPKGVTVRPDRTTSYPKSGVVIEWDSSVPGATEAATKHIDEDGTVDAMWAESRNTAHILKRVRVTDGEKAR